MDFGISLPTDPPTGVQVAKAKLAEAHGFRCVWSWDTHILMQEYSPQMTLIATQTQAVVVGSCVTNPVTREPTVVASFFATLANMVGGDRLICGIGRGDSAVRIRSARPSTLAALEESVRIIRRLTRGDEIEVDGHSVKLEWAKGGEVPVFVAAYGPKALALAGRIADGVIIQVADPFFVAWCLERVREGMRESERDPSSFRVQVAAPSFISADRADARDKLRWFPALVGNHIADILRHHDPETLPSELREYVDDRDHYDYRQHTRQGADHYAYVPDEIVDRFTVLGTVDECTERVRELESLGVTEYNIYTTIPEPEYVIETYGREIIPEFTQAATSSSERGRQ
jgi:probable F420-dependent oxidoreductase